MCAPLKMSRAGPVRSFFIRHAPVNRPHPEKTSNTAGFLPNRSEHFPEPTAGLLLCRCRGALKGAVAPGGRSTGHLTGRAFEAQTSLSLPGWLGSERPGGLAVGRMAGGVGVSGLEEEWGGLASPGGLQCVRVKPGGGLWTSAAARRRLPAPPSRGVPLRPPPA